MSDKQAIAFDPLQQWWGYSRHHGWVVLDRSLAINQPGGSQPLFFARCKDSHCYFETRKAWREPAYSFAPQFLKSLQPDRAQLETATLSALQEKWPELQAEIRRRYAEASSGTEAAGAAEAGAASLKE